ncbi:hypothetical protein, partial [Caballeronia ptereochthonis]|uniref:hypothetical protein n=1 Tax=Caballeronia ptereochthonis TaxID=1777144 RepID=UPI001ABF7FAC
MPLFRCGFGLCGLVFVGFVLVRLVCLFGSALCCLVRLGWAFVESCFLSGLLALPLCGAAVTFFAAAKKVTKESSFGPECLCGLVVMVRSGPA